MRGHADVFEIRRRRQRQHLLGFSNGTVSSFEVRSQALSQEADQSLAYLCRCFFFSLLFQLLKSLTFLLLLYYASSYLNKQDEVDPQQVNCLLSGAMCGQSVRASLCQVSTFQLFLISISIITHFYQFNKLFFVLDLIRLFMIESRVWFMLTFS